MTTPIPCVDGQMTVACGPQRGEARLCAVEQFRGGMFTVCNMTPEQVDVLRTALYQFSAEKVRDEAAAAEAIRKDTCPGCKARGYNTWSCAHRYNCEYMPF